MVMKAQFWIKHQIPGRVRIKAGDPAHIDAAAFVLNDQDSILSMRMNKACASLIILFDAEKNCAETILAQCFSALEQDIPKESLTQTAAQRSFCSCPARKHKSSVGRQLVRFLGLTAVMAGVFIREVIFKRPVLQGPFSVLGIISLCAAWPLFTESMRHIREKRFTLEGFLAAGCITATLAGEALTALEILWIQSGAETLNAWVSERSRKSVSDILDLTAKNTFILAGDVEVEVPISAVKIRDIVVLHTGEKISVDGMIISGQALVDDSPITGRAELAHVREGDTVYAGSYVRQGVIQVRAESVGDHTYLARIMRLVEDSLETRAPIESTADALAGRLVRLGLLATAGTFFLTGNLWRAFTVMLVMACPCATVLSAQTAVSAAMSAAAKRGILIKGGRYLEEVGKAEIVCFDKTGTLTSNTPSIEAILNFSDLSEDELLLWAYSAEMHNHHPLALAIKKEAQARNIDPIFHAVCDFTLGKGVRAVIGQDVIRLGNARYLSAAQIRTNHLQDAVEPLKKRGLTIIYLAKNTDVLAVLAFANEPRPDAESTVAALYASGVKKVVMLTGDAKNTALDLSAKLGIAECRYSVLPEQKGEFVKELQKTGDRVIMVGDGINDALALTEADIGIAMSAAGADVAIEAADIALVRDDLADILYVRTLSRRTLDIAHQNFWLATSTNIGGAIAGALGILSPVAAGLLHIVHTLGVLANSSRLLLPLSPAMIPAAPEKKQAALPENSTEK